MYVGFDSEEYDVSKLDAAHEQLGAAIRLFFSCKDSVAALTLACCAREIYEKHARRQGLKSSPDWILALGAFESEREYWKVMNYERNFFKHAGDSLEETVSLSDTKVWITIYIACCDCASLCGESTPDEVRAFSAWLKFRKMFDAGVTPSSEHDRELYRFAKLHFPDSIDLSDIQKRLFGQVILDCIKAYRRADLTP